MRIEVLDDAKDDLVVGFQFYEDQSPGLGSYFLDSLFEVDKGTGQLSTEAAGR